MRVEPIDLRPFRDGSDADRLAVAGAFDHAARTVGFFSITGHGVDLALIDEMLRVTGAFNVGCELTEAQLADPYYADHRAQYFAPNSWPRMPADLREIWRTYFAAVDGVANEVMSAAAVALGMPGDHFVAYLDKGPTVMRANNYQRRAGAPTPVDGQMRMGAHTDYGSITVLLADAVPGLQICDDAGTWHDVLPPAGGFIVNVGDLLAEWSNDRWRSTLHRVVPPAIDLDGPFRRRSIACFQQPNHDAVIECLPSCSDASNPPRYAPITSGEHLLAKLMGPRLLRPSAPSPRH